MLYEMVEVWPNGLRSVIYGSVTPNVIDKYWEAYASDGNIIEIRRVD